MNGIWGYALIMIMSVFAASCSQIILKRSANKNYKNKAAEYLNVRVIGAYGLFGLSALANMYILRHIPLSLATILESSGYVFVAILSYILLREKLNKIQLCGIALIVAGIIIFSM